MAKNREALIARVVDPIELDHAAIPVKRQMAMPGMVRAQESDQRAAGGRNFSGEILNVVAGAQQAKASAGIVPIGIDVQKHGDDFA